MVLQLKSQTLKYYSVFLLLIINAGGFAQISFENPQIINAKSGLPEDAVESIIKDDQGFMWFTTNKGLCRWDGISVRVFQHEENDTTSISGNYIPRNAFIWDSLSKQIVIGTENGLSFFDPRKLKFTNVTHKKEGPENFLSSINTVYIDRQNKLWIGSSMGLAQFEKTNCTSRLFPFDPIFVQYPQIDKKGLQVVFDIKQDLLNDSILWLATLKGLLKFNKYSKKFSLFCLETDNFKDELNTFNKISAHTNRKLYIGTWNADMVVFNTESEKFDLQFGPFNPVQSNFFPVPVIPFFQKSENELWVSSKEGVGVFNTKENKIHILHKFINEAGRGYLSNIAFIEENKTMWLASEYGVSKINLYSQSFQNYFMKPIDENYWFLPMSIYEDTFYQRLYVGYARGLGLHYFDLKTNTFHSIPFPKRYFNEIIVRDILPIDQDNLLVLCPDGIYKLSQKKGVINPVNINFKEIPKFTDMEADTEGRIWVSGYNIGLVQLNKKTGQIQQAQTLNNYFREKGISPGINNIVIDKYNKIWFRVYESYGYYNPANGYFRFFDGIDKLSLLCFYQDKTDTIWVGLQRNGLGFINPEEPENGVQIYKQGYKKSIRSLLKDSNGCFYFLTSDGIEKLPPGKERTVIFNKKEGLVKHDKWSNRDPSLPGFLVRLSDGRFVIAYRRGLGFFNPDSLHKVNEQLRPYISSIKVFDKEIPIEGGLFSKRKLELDFDQNFLTFECSALALNNGNDVSLSHKLTGVDRDWVDTRQKSANYANLQAGNYKFIVKAESKSAPGQVQETVLDITIHPPWWKTWWAFLGFLLLFLLLIYSIYRYQLNRVLARKETVRLKEINKMKSRLYTNITHEFRTPLTVIKGMTFEMRNNLGKEEQKHCDDKLEMIERNSDKLLHLVKQMLDMSKIEDGKMKLELIQDNIISYLQYVLESFQSMADAKNIKLVFYHETEKVVMDYDQDKIFKIASNLLTNAIKFTTKGGKIIFHVKREKDGDTDFLVIKVQDSGIGIEEEHLPHIFDRFYQVDNTSTRKGEGTGIGLALTKELVELMKGEISVKSVPGERTEFCVSIPITNRAVPQKSKAIKTRQPEIQKTTDDLIIINEKDGSLPLALVVEDNPDVAKYIKVCLEGKYRVQWSPDGQQGIDTAISTIPDIIISDVMMPEKDGFEVCETLKQDERTSHIPIILLTAKATDKDRIEGLSHGADAYLTKPFNREELFIRLKQLIKIRRQLQQKYSKVEITLTEKEQPKGEEIFLKKAIKVIEKQMDNPKLDPPLLAENLNLSESQLYRKLKALSGNSTSLFIRGIRLSAAKKLLETTSLHISEIAYQCGFNNPAWFSRAFKEEFGVSPSEHRK
jgi:signal transduction histidine kinase/ligand-binding sensor domain-containing protein/AraC-like DNA-binding protein